MRIVHIGCHRWIPHLRFDGNTCKEVAAKLTLTLNFEDQNFFLLYILYSTYFVDQNFYEEFIRWYQYEYNFTRYRRQSQIFMRVLPKIPAIPKFSYLIHTLRNPDIVYRIMSRFISQLFAEKEQRKNNWIVRIRRYKSASCRVSFIRKLFQSHERKMSKNNSIRFPNSKPTSFLKAFGIRVLTLNHAR